MEQYMNQLWKIEANIDNMNPEYYSAHLDELLSLGVKDAWLTPIIMKKGRPAILLSCLVDTEIFPIVENYLFKHTTTIGFRYYPVHRAICERKFEEVICKGKTVRIKVAIYEGEVVNASIEYEDLYALFKETGKPLKELEKEIWKKYYGN